ncbi:MAG: LCP family protein [Clostridia bacterium]|nr:LCP family protein [Clostridia bacterium]
MKKFLIFLLVVVGILFSVGFYFKNETYNVLVYGLEGKRSDVMMLVKVNGKDNVVDVIAIPRDTYYPVEGKNGLGQAKLNAVYGYAGTEGLMNAISDITGQEIDKFVEIKYEGVKAIVDTVGGITVDVPFTMKYDDPYAEPPLHINIVEGEQTLYGDDVIGYLRFRKSNDGKIKEGDIQRIERQQAFLKAAAKEIVPWKIWPVGREAIQYVDTDISLMDITKLSLSMIGTDSSQIYFHQLPEDYVGKGADGLSYFFYDEEDTKQLMEDIINNTNRSVDETEE